MATRYGHEIGQRLVDEKGWKWAPVDPEVYGDRWLIDPLTGVAYSPYDAKRVQDARDSRVAGDD